MRRGDEPSSREEAAAKLAAFSMLGLVATFCIWLLSECVGAK